MDSPLTSALLALESPPQWAVIAAAAVVITMVLLRKQWTRARRARQTGGKEVLGAAEHQRERLVTKADEILLTIEEISRETRAVLDNKIRRLEMLVDEADARIRELRSLVSGKPAPLPGSPNEETDPVRRQIYELHDHGVDVVEIARQTDLPPGEIQLILGLRPSRSDQPRQEGS